MFINNTNMKIFDLCSLVFCVCADNNFVSSVDLGLHNKNIISDEKV